VPTLQRVAAGNRCLVVAPISGLAPAFEQARVLDISRSSKLGNVSINKAEHMNMSTINVQWVLIAGAVAAALIALAVWLLYRKKQSKRLQDRFGPEYGRTVKDLGSQTKAESELKTRERRVELLDIAALTPPEAARFSGSWNALQSRFVDNPQNVVVQADQLVRELMLKRGYPMGDFEHRAADISVDHPAVVRNYRAAQAIAVRGERGQANTEELRQAVVHYRALFDELLEVKATGAILEVVPAKQVA
jgi:hypothetical protein